MRGTVAKRLLRTARELARRPDVEIGTIRTRWGFLEWPQRHPNGTFRAIYRSLKAAYRLHHGGWVFGNGVTTVPNPDGQPYRGPYPVRAV